MYHIYLAFEKSFNTTVDFALRIEFKTISKSVSGKGGVPALFFIPSSVMRGTLDPHTDPLRDLLECPMGENPGGRKPETQNHPIMFCNKTQSTSYKIHKMH